MTNLYIVDSILYPLKVIEANNREDALQKYAESNKFTSIEDLEDNCREEFGVQTPRISMVDIAYMGKTVH